MLSQVRVKQKPKTQEAVTTDKEHVNVVFIGHVGIARNMINSNCGRELIDSCLVRGIYSTPILIFFFPFYFSAEFFSLLFFRRVLHSLSEL